MNNKNLFNRKVLKSFRASLRNRSTSAEATLWEMLKSKKLDGRKFRRQYSIGSYIVDFCCPSEKLIIELDGDPHIIDLIKESTTPAAMKFLRQINHLSVAATPP